MYICSEAEGDIVYEAGACAAGACEAGACAAGAAKQKEISRNNIWPAIWSGDLSSSLQQVPYN